MKPRSPHAVLRLVDASPSMGDDAAGDASAAGPLANAGEAASAEAAPQDAAPVSRAAPRSSRAGSPSLGDLPDGRLVVLGRAGDRAALEALYRRHASFAIHLAARIEGSSRDVEDIVHDAFIKAFSRLGDLHDPNAFRGWLGSIVVFAVRSRLRRHRLMAALGLRRGVDPIDLDQLVSPDASPHTRAQLAQVYALLRTLPTDERIAWTLRAVEGHELEVVARLTDCSLATVKRRIARAQRFLDDHFIAVGSTNEPVPPTPTHESPAADPRRARSQR